MRTCDCHSALVTPRPVNRKVVEKRVLKILASAEEAAEQRKYDDAYKLYSDAWVVVLHVLGFHDLGNDADGWATPMAWVDWWRMLNGDKPVLLENQS